MRGTRWRATAGLATLVFATVITAVLLLFGIGLLTYQQLVATRQVVAATATAALRAAVPAGLHTEALATAQSLTATGLQMDATAYVAAVEQTLPSFWAGSSVAPCTTTPAGSPVACTPHTSFLITLPPSTATALHITGPLVLTAIQVTDQPPFQVTLGTRRIDLGTPGVAAEVAVPLHLVVGGLLTMNPWATVAITQAVYADQGTVAGAPRYLSYASAPATGSGPPSASAATLCWQWPDAQNAACATRPAWCPADATACQLNPGQIASGDWINNPSVTVTLADGRRRVIALSAAAVAALPWVPRSQPGCWVETSVLSAGWVAPPAASCLTLPSRPPAWATTIFETAGMMNGRYQVVLCATGPLPGSPQDPATGTTPGIWCQPSS